jgi:hypothetical protein
MRLVPLLVLVQLWWLVQRSLQGLQWWLVQLLWLQR